MRARTELLTAFALAALLAGCASPTPREQQMAEDGKAQVAELLRSFSAAVKQDQPVLLGALMAPDLKTRERRRMERRLQQAGWLELYDDYDLEIEEAVADVKWKRWQEKAFWLEVPGTGYREKEFTDEFEVVRTDQGWRMRDFKMTQPEAGDPISPSQDVRAAIMPQVKAMLERLKASDAAGIHYEVLPEGAQYRRPILTWWQRLTESDVPPIIAVLVDVQQMANLTIEDWPPPEEELAYVFAPPNGVVAVYEVFYVWPAAGIETADVLRIHVAFLPADGGWALRGLRLVGKAIVYSGAED